MRTRRSSGDDDWDFEQSPPRKSSVIRKWQPVAMQQINNPNHEMNQPELQHHHSPQQLTYTHTIL
ncbi:MAG: hypothetical protein IJ640_09830 [Prevotella sp.]|nr:hypothetical protein [Prevotella sp.]